MVSVDEEGYASIYLNARLSEDKRKRCLQHELRHLENDDFYSDTTIQAAERAADGAHSLTRANTPPLLKARDLPRPGRRHDKAELKIQQERMNDWKHDWLLQMDEHDYW